MPLRRCVYLRMIFVDDISGMGGEAERGADQLTHLLTQAVLFALWAPWRCFDYAV